MMDNFPYTPRLQHPDDTELEKNRGGWNNHYGMIGMALEELFSFLCVFECFCSESGNT